MRQHTRTPVPVCIWGPHIRPDAVTEYSEKAAPNGSLGFMTGDAFIRMVLDL